MNHDMRDFYQDPVEREKWGKQAVDLGLYPTEAHLIARHFRPGAAVLDVGCGGGREALALAKMGFDVTAIDNQPAFVEACQNEALRGGLDLVVMQAEAGDLPFDDNQFDHVLMVGQLLGHIRGREHRQAVLRQIRRVMKPGVALVSTNAVEHRRLYRAFFALVNAGRKLYNPHRLEPFDAFVRRIGGRRQFGARNRPVFHWYRTEEFQEDAQAAGWRIAEQLRRDEFEKQRGAGGETFYVLRKEEE